MLDEGEIYRAAGFELEARLIPGHSAGHMVYIAKHLKPIVVFGGDVLFAGSIGRTDFPGGSFDALAEGIHKKLFTLPDDTIVLPGHGPATTIGDEKEGNPYVGRAAGWRGSGEGCRRKYHASPLWVFRQFKDCCYRYSTRPAIDSAVSVR